MIPVKAITKNTAKRSCPFENIALIFYEIKQNNSNPLGFKIMLIFSLIFQICTLDPAFCENNQYYDMIKKELNAVQLFHEAFGIEVNEKPTIDLSEKIKELRYNLMKEENEEYLEAVQNNDLVEVADALGDMLYILCGTILTHGMQYKITEVFEEIQRSNMSKLDSDGNPIYREDGKVMKGPNYFKPNIEAILKQ